MESSDGEVLDFDRTVRLNAGDDMMYVHHGRNKKLKAGNDMKNVHSKSKCGNIKGDVISIRRPSSDGSANRIDRAHFESGSDEPRKMSWQRTSAEYCDDSSRGVNVIDGAIEVDSLEVSTGDADESNNSFLYVERFGQRKERMKVNTCEYDGKSECSVLYVERFGQRKQSSGANTYGSISSLKVDEFGRADNCKSSLKVDEFGRARSDDSLKVRSSAGLEMMKMAWKPRSSAGLVVVVISRYSVRQQVAWSKR
jgi:hypothetical protein